HAPLRIRGKRLRGGTVALDASKSSQFVSALAMVAPSMADGLRIELGGRVPSMPYLNMTLRMLEARGIDARMEAYTAV
ncbi:3-phosphoshikimate 1-carboxyvinyltransferase, partial [Klebsiella oxytoca]